MTVTAISGGTVHTLPLDIRKTVSSNKAVLAAWEDLTPLARNEWICWVISVKKQETREGHIKGLVSRLKEGKRRPCCWIGCIHRKDKAISPSVKAVLARQPKKV